MLIIGAGSAGSVLAARLSADESCRVAIVEAGPEPSDPRVRAQISDGLRLPIGWASSVVRHYSATMTDDPVRHVQITRGSVVGGSGAVNGGYFCRGPAADFDRWSLPGWRWHDVLPHFMAIENDLDFPGPLHGSDGPIQIQRVREFDGPTASFVESALAAGHVWIDDLNGGSDRTPVSSGVGAVPLNIDGGTRMGPGGAFLMPALDRPNLHLQANTTATRVRIAGDRATGVECVGSGGATEFTADRIVLCAGAIGSAHLLMLSGIGPEPVLRAAGIPVQKPLPVGSHSTDHPEWVLPVDWIPTYGLPPLEAVLTTPGLEIRPYTAGFDAMVHGPGDNPADRPHLGVAVMQPRSRGRVTVASPDPAVPPVIEYRYDSSAEDVAALRAGAELARELISGTAQVGTEAWSTSQHLVTTAPMGVEGDPTAVVDARCRVFGIEGLWVVDGSVMPTITGRGPHATIAMIGHRAAEFVVSRPVAPPGQYGGV